MNHQQPQRFKTISESHQMYGIAKPIHPLISVINFEDVNNWVEKISASRVFDFYVIALKRNFTGKIKYGQQQYDFDEGIMTFMSPNQVLNISYDAGQPVLRHAGWLLMFHPDLLWNTPLVKQIKQYEYFDYSVHEALFLSEKEEALITAILQNIQQEYHENIDKFSHGIIIAQLELLLTYAERFYQRQFLTRRITNHKLLDRLEAWLTDYFSSDNLVKKGLPSVQNIANSLNVSPNYLSGLIKALTGQSTQQHIHNKLIEKAKEKLSVTDLSVSEIAYELGFEHPQSFSKLFKTKTAQSPLEFRNLYN